MPSPVAPPVAPRNLATPAWRYVPAPFDAGDLAQLEARFAELADRPLVDRGGLEHWLRDESELLARIGAELARRYVRMTRHTDDAAAKAAYLAMEQEVMPRVKVLGDQLDRKFLACPFVASLDPARYAVLVRRRRTQAELFRTENTALQQQEAELQTRQQALMGAITVPFDGKTLTLQQLAPYYEQQDRALRERAFRAGLAARAQRWNELEDIYDRLVALRTGMARNAGHTTYTPYRFLDLGRYDYDEAKCRQFHDAIAECVVPVVRQFDRERAARLGLPRLRPWDLEVDPEGRPPLRPFATEEQLLSLVRRLFAAVDPGFLADFDVLVDRQLLDLMSRAGKAPGGYQYQLEDERVPFVFANAVGLHGDVQTLLHEGGHAFHSLACRDHDLLAFRDYPIEMAETASMSMELLGLEHLGAVYSAEEAQRAYRRHLEGVLRTLTWIASIDAIQHWVYGRPNHTRDERRTAWLDIRRRFGGDVDWSGLDDALAMQWIGQAHLFTHAFYYIEYGIAQLAALQVWRNYRRDRKAAVAAYRKALELGGTRPLPELFAAAGVSFDLSPRMLQGLVDEVLRQVRR
ncbi:MAG: M3 family oligoendopeptidase [Planctomycetes bacterium]|nr:M3 family oligoendopeptidase [Planctomycetota bacterium]